MAISPTYDPAKLMSALDNETNSGIVALISESLTTLEHIYALGLDIFLSLEAIGLRKRFVSPVPTISVGNLAVGGTGKTPAVIEIASKLNSLGLKIAILSRGHGGSKSKSTGIVSNEQGEILLDISESGDEPMMLAESLRGVPVLVGKDRRKTAALAVQRFMPDVLLLDDGFQYWQLARDLDIVLLDATHPFDNGHCLPRGLLREPKSNLKRAKLILVTRSATLTADDRTRLTDEIRLLNPFAEIFFAVHANAEIRPLTEAARLAGRPIRPIAVSAIARPESFHSTLFSAGIEPIEVLSFKDHYRYSNTDAARIATVMAGAQSESIITTAKDSVKLERVLPNIAIFAQEIRMDIADSSSFLLKILSSIGMQSLANIGHTTA